MTPKSRHSSGICFLQNLTYEIILTLGQAFEVAYQLALQAQKSRSLGASAVEMIETKSSKPVPKPRVGTRKSAVRGPSRKTPGLPDPGLQAWGGAGAQLGSLLQGAALWPPRPGPFPAPGPPLLW